MTEESQSKVGHAPRIGTYLAEIDAQMPALAYLGFGFICAWTLVAFSGSIWLNDTGNSHGLSDLFTWTLASEGISLFVLALFSKWTSRLVPKCSTLLAAGLIGAVGGTFIILARPGLLGSVIYLYLGCILEGMSTAVLFLRGATLFGAQSPRLSLRTLALTAFFAVALYYLLIGIPHFIGIVMFCLLPMLSALCYCLHTRPTLTESLVIGSSTKLSRRFLSFIVAILVLSVALQLIKGYLFIELPPTSTIESYGYALMIYLIVLLFLLGFSLSSHKATVFGNSYRIISLVLIMFLIVAPFLQMSVALSGSVATVVYLVFDITIWGMLAYVVYQAKSDAIRVFSLGCGALSAGAAGGNIIAFLIINGGIGETTYFIVCLVLAIASIIIALFVFPESAIKELLLPIEDDEADDEKKAMLGRWRGSCLALAAKYGLSEREQEVFILLAKDKSAQQISEKLVISPHTVRAHIRSIYAKLDVHSHVELVHLVEKEEEQYAPEPGDAAKTSSSRA